MPDFDLAIRGGTVITASDTFRADVGVRGGRIVAVAERIEGAAREIDASGLLVMPGGIDSHVHLSQPAFGGPKMADDFLSRHALGDRRRQHDRAAVCAAAARRQPARQRDGVPQGGRRQVPGGLRLPPDHHRPVAERARARSCRRWSTTATRSFKVFMTYDDLVLNDRQLLEVFECARGCRALVMVHCEGYDAIKFMTERLEQAGKTAPYYHAVSRPEIGRARGRAPGDQPCRAARRADHDRARLRPRGDGADPLGAAARTQGLRRDLPAIHRAHRRRSQGPQHGRERRQICLLAAAARPRQLGRDLGGDRAGRVPDLLVRSLPVLFRRPAGQEESEGADLVPLGAERHPGRGDAAADPVEQGRRRRPHHRQRVRGADLDQSRQDVRPLSEEGLDRGRLRCRHRALGRQPQGDHPPGDPASTAPTTRPTKGSRSPAGR